MSIFGSSALRRPAACLAMAMAVSTVAACGSTVLTGSGGGGSAGTGGGSTGGSCPSERASGGADCSGDCQLLLHAEIPIYHEDVFYDSYPWPFVLGVAATNDRVYASMYLEMGASDLFEIHGNGFERVNDFPRGPANLAVDGSGRLHAAVRTSGGRFSADDDDDLVHVVREGASFTQEQVTGVPRDMLESASRPLAFEVAADGTPHILFGHGDSKWDVLARKTAAGAWEVVAADSATYDPGESPEGYWSSSFALTLAADGSPAMVGERGEFNEESHACVARLSATIAGEDGDLGGIGHCWDWSQWTVSRPPPQVAPNPPIHVGAIKGGERELRLAWLPADGTLDSFAEIILEGTRPATLQCPDFLPQEDDRCPDRCHETSSGVELGALARTLDGALWVAYVKTYYDVWVTYERDWDPDNEKHCRDRRASCDATTSDLHVLRLAPGSNIPQEMLRLPVRGPIFGSVEARPFENDVAIAFVVGRRIHELPTEGLSDAPRPDTLHVLRLSASVP
jgi:hypothetical protein